MRHGGGRSAGRLMAGGALLVAVPLLVAGWGRPLWWALPVAAVAATLAELTAGPIGSGPDSRSVSLIDGVVAAGLLLAPGGWPVPAAVAGLVVARRLLHQPVRWVEVARLAAATATAAALTVRLGGGVGGVAAGMAAYWLVGALTIVPGASVRVAGWRPLPPGVTPTAVHTAAATSLGLLAAELALRAPAGLIALAVPVVWLALSNDVRSIGGAESRLFAELARGHQVAGGSLDVSAQAVITAAGRLIAAGEVEMVLLGADGPVRYASNGGAVSRRRVEADAFDQPWVIRALGTGGIRTGTAEGRPYCSAVVGKFGDLTGPLAVLAVRRPAGAPGFGRRDVRLVRLLVRQAECWLPNGGPTAVAGAFGPRGAVELAEATEAGAHPSHDLTLLRDSARRLSALTGGPADPEAVGQIVEELHSVERAVASLLGALAMTTAQELADRAELSQGDPSPAQRAAEEWTTTGVLRAMQIAS